VKAFNHLPLMLLARDPGAEGGRRVLFYAGDDAAAKARMGELIGKLGFFGIDRLSRPPGAPHPMRKSRSSASKTGSP